MPGHGFGLDFAESVSVSLVWEDSPADIAGCAPANSLSPRPALASASTARPPVSRFTGLGCGRGSDAVYKAANGVGLPDCFLSRFTDRFSFNVNFAGFFDSLLDR